MKTTTTTQSNATNYCETLDGYEEIMISNDLVSHDSE